MSVFYCPVPRKTGGRNSKSVLRIVADEVRDLIQFEKNYHGSLILCPPELRNAEQEYRLATLEQQKSLAVKLQKMNSYAIELKSNYPSRGPEMHKRARIHLYISPDQEELLIRKDIAQLPEAYIPLLTVIMKEQYCRRSGVGITPEMAEYFRIQKRGKMIDLCQSGRVIDNPDHESVVKLHAALEKIDRGQRSDLKFSSNQDETSEEKRRRYARGAEKRAEAFWAKRQLEIIGNGFTPPVVPTPVKSGSTSFEAFYKSQKSAQNGLNWFEAT